MNLDHLRALWSDFWEQLDPNDDSDATFEQLVRAYANPPRHYHTLEHIAFVLKEFVVVRDRCTNPLAAEAALWFHDAIYDSRTKDNEERSALLARDFLLQAGCGGTFLDLVRDLILATKHGARFNVPDVELVTDCDLAILGQPAEVFDQYEEGVRQEYAWVPDVQFRAGRSARLRLFLERPAIYSTEFFRAKYEAAARANLERSLQKLAFVAPVNHGT